MQPGQSREEFLKNTYLAEISDLEALRLTKQNQVLLREAGGLLPQKLWNSAQKLWNSAERILDVGCGPGNFCLTVAERYPKKEVFGIDHDPRMLEYATGFAQAEGLENVTFKDMDATKPLRFPPASFGVITGHLVASFLEQESWPTLLKQCFRLLTSGGVVCFIEFEDMSATGPACERLFALFNEAGHRVHRGFSVSGRTYGPVVTVKRFLREAGFEKIDHQPVVLDYSFGSEGYEDGMLDAALMRKTFKPFIVNIAQVMTNEEWVQLQSQSEEELKQPDFCGMSFCTAVWGVKP